MLHANEHRGTIGRVEEAHNALEKAIELSPRYFDLYVRTCPPGIRPEDHVHLLAGLRKAGLQG
jgi:adenylate cyclase